MTHPAHPDPPPLPPEGTALAERLGFTARDRPYLATHWQRLAATEAHLPAAADLRLLDIGTAPPFPFLALAAARRPRLAAAAVTEPDPHDPRLWHSAPLPDGQDVRIARVDIDRETLPFASDSFDCVTALEILEHLVLNPLILVREAARILVPGGRFILTTPNIVGAEALARLLAGDSPYSFGAYTAHGFYGRHNREFTPHEVAALAQAVGFETELLTTADFYPKLVDTAHATALLAGRGADPALRRQTIVYVGRKRRFDPTGYPPALFAHDPTARGTAMALLPPTATGRLALELTNLGSTAWPADPQDATAPVLVGAQWRVGGETRFDDGRIRLPRDLAPGETLRLVLPLTHPDLLAPSETAGEVVLEPIAENEAWFSQLGLTRPLVLPAREAEVARLRTAGQRDAAGRVRYDPPPSLADIL